MSPFASNTDTSVTTDHPRYDEYEDSGVDWLREIPAHWKVVRVQHVADIHPSSVDKKSEEDETPIKLCNYTDVYYGHRISDASEFMEATATASEIETHELQAGDVLVTKDSEARDDIAVPALIGRDMPGVLCGYHLAQLRPSERIDGAYLYYCFKTPSVSAQFEAAATGITRYGLGVHALKKSHLYLPPLDEQRAIAAYLDRETERIDALIEKKEQLIDLLEEKRNSLISRVVTKGLDDNVEMQDSGVEWLGEIPAHWESVKLKFLTNDIIDAEHKTAPFYPDGDYLVVRTSNIRDGDLRMDGAKFTDKEGFREWTQRGVPKPGDILLTREAPAGEACVVPEGLDLCLGQRVVLLRTKKNLMDPHFCVYALYSGLTDEFISMLSQGSTVEHFNISDIANLPILLPPIREQHEIVEYLRQEIGKIDTLTDKIDQGIKRLKEYRTALISATVTGQIDVREATHQPVGPQIS